MQNINQLFNQIFKTSNENYVSGNEAITNCRKNFLALKDDKITNKVLLYFFPVHPKCEENENEFWFCKYKNDNEYDEYDFAEDLLKNHVEYLSDKNEKNFETRLEHILLKFENYKMFSLYIYNIQGYTDNLMSTIAYFTKDPSYYLNNLNAYVSPESIQTKEFIDNLKKIVEKKIIYYDKLVEIHKLKEQINNKNNQEINYQKKILELSEELLNRGKKMTAFLEDKIKQDSQIKALQEEKIAFQEDKIKQDSQIKAFQEDKIKQDSQIKAFQEDKIKQDSQIKALQEDKIKQDSQIKALQEDKIKQDSQIKAFQEDKIKQDSQLKALQEEKIALQEEKIKQDSQIKALQEEKIKQDSQIIALQEEKFSQIQAFQEENNSQIQVLQNGQKNTDSQLKIINDNDEKKEARFKILEDYNRKLKADIEELQKRMDKIDLRDTIKYCIKYLYKILRSKFTEMKEVNNFWEEIKEIKMILSRKEFKQFQYINDFIDDIDFTGLNSLNTATHNASLKKRKIEDIKKYLENNSMTNYDNVVKFFRNLPNVYDFIELYLMFYISPEKAETEFQSKFKKFSDVYNQIFGNI